MSAFLGEIAIFSFNFPPGGWAFCNGQLLPINQNQPLFSLFGTSFGGNGQTTFAIPDLRGRAPMHRGSSQNGEKGGEYTHTLNYSEMPEHTHKVNAGAATFKAGNTANKLSPDGNYFGENTAETKRFSAHADTGLANTAPTLQPVGGNGAHNNMQPYLVLNFCVCLVGIFPSRN